LNLNFDLNPKVRNLRQGELTWQVQNVSKSFGISLFI